MKAQATELHASTQCPKLLGPPDPCNPCRCNMGDEQAVRLLLELGADPNAGGTHGRTALGALSSALSDPCCGQIAALLLQHGADCLLPVSYSSHSLVAYEVRQGRRT